MLACCMLNILSADLCDMLNAAGKDSAGYVMLFATPPGHCHLRVRCHDPAAR